MHWNSRGGAGYRPPPHMYFSLSTQEVKKLRIKGTTFISPKTKFWMKKHRQRPNLSQKVVVFNKTLQETSSLQLKTPKMSKYRQKCRHFNAKFELTIFIVWSRQKFVILMFAIMWISEIRYHYIYNTIVFWEVLWVGGVFKTFFVP